MMRQTGDKTAHSVLRVRTAQAHEAVDVAFGLFSLADAASYRRMLLAHGSVLPPLESRLLECPALPAWRSRLVFLEADLAALGEALPKAVVVEENWSAAELHGLLYVLEGSRLGGKMMARQIPDTLPAAFLGAGHEKGEWRTLLDALDREAQAQGDVWLEKAVTGALRGFDLYEGAARHFTN